MELRLLVRICLLCRLAFSARRIAALFLQCTAILAVIVPLLIFSATPARANCSTPTAGAGATEYFTTPKVFKLCDGTNWIPYSTHQWVMVSGAAFDATTCGIRHDGTLWCWGANNFGQIGDNTTTARHVPTLVSGGYTWKIVSVGYGYTCGIQTNNTLWCWGSNGNGNLGDGTGTERHVPTQVSGGGAWKAVGAGGTTCAIKTNGVMYCMGYGGWGQLGNGSGTVYVPTQVANVGTNSWKSVSIGLYHACAIQSDNSLWCWGRNASGSNGNNSTTQISTPTAVSGGGTWQSISAGSDLTCGIKTGGAGFCWGYGTAGGLGNGTTTAAQKTPTAMTTTGVNTWSGINVGDKRACGILTDGKAYCWGVNGSGQGGTGSTNTQNNSPVIVTGGSTWLSPPATEINSSCALKSDSSMWCWGANGSGEIGDNTVTQRNSPVATLFTMPTCATGGMIEYDSTLSAYKYCNSTNWIPFYCDTSSCTCTLSACTTPNAIQYFSTGKNLAFCNNATDNWEVIANPTCP